MEFDEWFNQEKNMDLRMPTTCDLSFTKKLTIEEWQELVRYIYRKCLEFK